MNYTLRTLIDWINGDISFVRPAVRDGVYVVMGWREMQERRVQTPYNRLDALMWLFVVSIALPILAFAAPQNIEFTNIPVLKENVQRGEVLTPEMFDTRKADTTRLSDKIVRHQRQLIGKETTRNLHKGMMIFESYARPVPKIKKDSLVEMIYDVNGLKLTGTAQALEDGKSGQLIRVMNMDSKKIVTGRVTADGNIEMN